EQLAWNHASMASDPDLAPSTLHSGRIRRELARAVTPLTLQVGGHRTPRPLLHGLVHPAHHSAWARQHDRASRYHHALPDQCSGANRRSGSDPRSVQDYGAHPDQAVVLDRAAMDDRAMAYRHSRPDEGGESRVAVDDRAILYARVGADPDLVGVGAQHRVRPDRRPVAEQDASAEECGWMHECGHDLGLRWC